MRCCAMSATGMTSSDPGTFTHQVLCPSRYGSSAGRWSRFSESRRSLPVCRSTMSWGVTSSTEGSTSAPASRVGEEVRAGVIGEEQFGGVEAGRGGEGAPGRRARVVGGVGRVAGVPGDRVVPAGRPAHGAEHQHPLELGERYRFVPGPVGERAVGYLIAERETPGPSSEQRLDQREGGQVLQRVAPDARSLASPGTRNRTGAYIRTRPVARIHGAVLGKPDIE